jgi:hypothetical protein
VTGITRTIPLWNRKWCHLIEYCLTVLSLPSYTKGKGQEMLKFLSRKVRKACIFEMGNGGKAAHQQIESQNEFK